ncbi:MAG TPA: LamG domain-containing protein [Mucilaginibacter sp.]|nr:LamG domain-containing protein [Mucilaginibacter sp.]
MKRLNICFLALALTGVGLTSCHKEFNPKSYAPPLSVGGYTSVKEIAKDNLVAYYSFDGTLVDSVSNSSGTSTGTAFTTGFEGKALQGGLNSYVLAQPSAAISSLKSFTITEWYNSAPPGPGIIGIFTLAKTSAFWGNIEVFFENGSTNDNGKVRVHIAQGSGDYTYSVDGVKNLFDKWTNFGFSYDAASSTATLYINGSKVASGAIPGLTGDASFSDVGNLTFGCVQFMTNPSQTSATGSQPWASYLTGQLDEVRVYNKALSAAEIGAIVGLEGRGK